MRLLSAVLAVTAVAAACGRQEASTPPAPAGPVAAPHATLAQVMRGIPFPASNIIFDTQSKDPGAPPKPADIAAGATATYANVYGGWQEVENSALMLAETANLLLIPGRSCENGRPAPVEREDYRRFAQGLIDAGNAAYKAAQTKSVDAMVEVTGTVADACAACHEVYRDKDDPKDRCIP